MSRKSTLLSIEGEVSYHIYKDVHGLYHIEIEFDVADYINIVIPEVVAIDMVGRWGDK